MRVVAAASVVVAVFAVAALAQDKGKERETRVRDDKAHVSSLDSWIYDDLPRGVEEAKKSGKPLLVVFRCIPCEACAQLDEDVVNRDPAVAKLLDRFVCVRVPHANGIDLSVFQFDWDQSWAAFFLEPDMTILGRYGTRSHRTDSSNDVSLEGFAQAMERALELHSPKAKENPALAGKQSEPLSVARPEQYASLKRYTPSLDWEGKVVKSCMHCHMVAEAQRHEFRSAGMDLPERLLFPYPNPKALGLVMDPKSAARVQSVAPGSAAEKGGFQAGDEIRLLHGQAIVSTADIQWVLENAGVTDEIRADVLRGGKPAEPSPKLVLTEGWRAKDDITWRVTSWDLRRMTTGGMVLEAASDAERAKLGIEKGAMALVAKHVGQYGEHAAAKNAGFVKGDVIVAVDGRTDVVTETQWLTWLVNAKKPGDKIAVTMLRDGKKSELSLPIQ